MIAGLEDPTSGRVMLNGHVANEMPPHERNVAMVFQELALYPHLTVRDNLAFPLRISGMADEAIVDDRIREIAHGLEIEDTLDRKPAMLSGGQRQRVAMGRALIRGKPAVLLMDEPLASLDVGLRGGLRAEIASLIRALTTIYVTHDQVEAMSLADRIAVMREGVIEDIGTPGRIYSDPGTAFVAAFLGSPPVNLAWASIWVVNGDRVVIDFGTQHLDLGWTDSRSESLTPYHGQPVIVGIRPENLIPSQAGADGTGLRGRISSLEYHGHQWLAHLEVGFRPVDLSRVRARPGRSLPPPAGRGRHGQSAYDPARRGAERAADEDPAAWVHHGEHRSAHLLVRLDSPQGWVTGQEATVAVDVPHIYVFAADGRRIGSWQTMRLPSRARRVIDPAFRRRDPASPARCVGSRPRDVTTLGLWPRRCDIAGVAVPGSRPGDVTSVGFGGRFPGAARGSPQSGAVSVVRVGWRRSSVRRVARVRGVWGLWWVVVMRRGLVCRPCSVRRMARSSGVMGWLPVQAWPWRASSSMVA
jgi:multiple sugar transport system ATP-binding protein